MTGGEINIAFAGRLGEEAAEVVMEVAEFVGGGFVAGSAVELVFKFCRERDGPVLFK